METPFIQAANYTHGKRNLKKDILFLVVHDEESPEVKDSAVNIAHFFANQPKNGDGSSAHRTVDNREVVKCVRLGDIAWAAPGGNTNGIHWEHAGYASETKRDWEDAYSTEMLNLSAEDMAKVARLCGFKIEELKRLTPEEIRSYKVRGICGHLDITHAFPNIGTHTDPGLNFPWKWYIDQVRYHFSRL